MWQELLQHDKGFLVEFCRRLRGADRRAFQAEVATEVCGGSPRRAESMFGWSRKSVDKGLIEQEYNVELQPHFDRRGRRAWEVQTPVLVDVVTEVLDAQSQADPKFQTSVLFTRATGRFLRSLWESHPDLADTKPPSVRTCQRLMNRLGPVKAADHDMHPEAKLVPLGILEVDSGQLFLSLGQSAKTSDFIADGIEDWWLTRREAHLGVRKAGAVGNATGTDAADRCGLQRSQTLPR